MKVRFIAQAPEQFTGELRFAVTVCRHEEKWVYCQHRQRESFEIPGGHIEPGENPEQAARRELYEETGALATPCSRSASTGWKRTELKILAPSTLRRFTSSARCRNSLR